MGEVVTTNKYLDINGLEKYDGLIKNYIDGKVDIKQGIISDLEEIRTGSHLGATALQSIPEEYITEDELESKDFTTKTEVENLINNSIFIATDSDVDDIFK